MREREKGMKTTLKDPIFLSGEKIYLEPLSTRHFSQQYLSWLNDAAVCRENRHAVFPYTALQLRNYVRQAPRSRDSLLFAIRLKQSGRHVGNAGIINLSWTDRSAEISLLIGDKRVWGRGVGFDVCQVLKGYCFDRLNMHRVWLGATATNTAMNRIAERLDMKKEGRFKDFIYKEGRYLDVIQWFILNPKD